MHEYLQSVCTHVCLVVYVHGTIICRLYVDGRLQPVCLRVGSVPACMYLCSLDARSGGGYIHALKFALRLSLCPWPGRLLAVFFQPWPGSASSSGRPSALRGGFVAEVSLHNVGSPPPPNEAVKGLRLVSFLWQTLSCKEERLKCRLLNKEQHTWAITIQGKQMQRGESQR